jgi:hypothetical protein
MLGFMLSVTFDAAVSEAERGMMVDDLMALLDRHGLAAADPHGRAMELSVRRDGSQATDADRAIVRDWAARWTPYVVVDVGDITDLSRSG